MKKREQISELKRHLAAVIEYAEGKTCCHESTHRGGSIWEICDDCGVEWADDKGGKPTDAHDEPSVLFYARHCLKHVSE